MAGACRDASHSWEGKALMAEAKGVGTTLAPSLTDLIVVTYWRNGKKVG